ncbi:hypothetical protein ACWGHD_19010 [Streptomyces xanthophaeus]
MSAATGGWSLSREMSPPGTLSLMADHGSYDVVYDDNPLSVSQLRALANLLDTAAAELAADMLEDEA